MKKFPATLLLIFCTLPTFTQIKGVLMEKL